MIYLYYLERTFFVSHIYFSQYYCMRCFCLIAESLLDILFQVQRICWHVTVLINEVCCALSKVPGTTLLLSYQYHPMRRRATQSITWSQQQLQLLQLLLSGRIWHASRGVVSSECISVCSTVVIIVSMDYGASGVANIRYWFSAGIWSYRCNCCWIWVW